MDTSTRFFAKLRSLALILETERTNLEQSATHGQDMDEDELKSGAVRALHELHSEVKALKRTVQSQVTSQENDATELRGFIKTCMVLKRRTTDDIERIQRHYEKYGYKQLKAGVTAEVNTDETDIRSHVDNEMETEPAETEEGDERKEAEAQKVETPVKMHVSGEDLMRTPQLSDFGLSSLHLQMVLGKAEMVHEVVPAVALTPPPLIMSKQEFQPKTPRCSLRMDEDALTPRLEDFGITENTMCLNTDLTMDLFRKKPLRNKKTNSETQETAQRPPYSSSGETISCVAPAMLSNDSMESPEVPVFSTLDFTINKHLGTSGTVPNKMNETQSPTWPSHTAATPELPAFETPYINKLISAKKEIKNCEMENNTSLQTSTFNPSEYPVRGLSPDVQSVPACFSQNEDVTPEMPRLQSCFGSSLPYIGHNRSALTESSAPVLQTDDEATQDWCPATPRVRMEFGAEPQTPEMPDMSSITQDIFKLVHQASNKQVPHAAVQQMSKAGAHVLAHGKENRAHMIDQVSEKDFNALASYMKQIPLPSLNLAIEKINQVIDERCREGNPNFAEFHIEDLRRVLEVGFQAPKYILCLVELKRLENVQGVGRNATFKVPFKV